MAKKKDKDKFNYEVWYRTYKYRVSEDNLNMGDYYYDFILNNMGGNPIQTCDTQSLADQMNAYYAKKEFKDRKSAKIVATNNPILNAKGIPEL